MSGPSDKAVEMGQASLRASGLPRCISAEKAAWLVLFAAYDPALGLDRSVCLRDVVDVLRRVPKGMGALSADFIEREFGGGS